MKAPLAAGALALLCTVACSGTAGSYSPAPVPTLAPLPAIKHVLVLVQENRSFNSMFLGFPGAVTAASGPCRPIVNQGQEFCKDGKPVALHAITLETCRCTGGTDIAHDHQAFEIEFDRGKMDGFAGINSGTTGIGPPAGTYPYAYVVRREVQPYWDMAKRYALADMMFSTATTDSFVAHQQLIAGTTRLNATESLVDTPSSAPWGCDAPQGTVTSIIQTNGRVIEGGGPFPCLTQYPSMANVLDAANVSWKYYVESYDPSSEDFDFSGLVWNAYDAIRHVRYGPDWTKHVSMPNTTIFTDIQKGNLPEVAWIVPSLADSDHPASGSNTGPSWVSSIVNAVGKSKYWKSTAILVLWDDWGGFYDPVAPQQTDYTSLGMRVPLLAISPYARPGYVSHTQYDFGSVLRYIEENFGTASLGASDATANSIDDVFDYSQQPVPFSAIAAPYPQRFFLQPRPRVDVKALVEKDGYPE